MNKKILVIAVVLLLAALLVSPLIGTVAAWIGHNEENEQKECKPRGGWTLVTNGRAVSAYPELREYLWQKNAAMAPNGPYDKIALHRLVKADSKPIGVIFITPGLYCSGEQLLSVFANTENNNQPIYWANRGFDVYTIDYRTHFVPSTLSPDQLSFMAEWGLDQFVNDVKEAVDKAKQVSHTNKIFIAGESLGGAMAMFYAAKYWREDLKGIILLDSAGIVKNTATTNTFNLPAAVDAMKASGNYAYEMPYLPMPGATVPPSGMIFLYQYAASHPDAPAEFPPGTPLEPLVNPLTNEPWANIAEWVGFMTPNFISNIAGGYGTASGSLQWTATLDRYFPIRLFLDWAAMSDWDNSPYLKFDYDEYFRKIDVPRLAFTSELFGLAVGYGTLANIKSTDLTQIILPNYGHIDVYVGTYSARDVSRPTYQWMVTRSLHNDRLQLFGVAGSYSFLDTLNADHQYYPSIDNQKKLVITQEENMLTYEITVGGVTYTLGKDFTYSGHAVFTFYDPVYDLTLGPPLYPSGFSSAKIRIIYKYDFSAVPGGLDGTIRMIATLEDGVLSIRSTGGTGDFRHVQITAAAFSTFDAVNFNVNIFHDGLVSGWPRFQKFEVMEVRNRFVWIHGEHQFIPSKDNVKKLIVSGTELGLPPMSCDITVGTNTYQLGTDFTYTGNFNFVFYDVTEWFVVPQEVEEYEWPREFTAEHSTLEYTYEFLPASGIEGTIQMRTVITNSGMTISSLAGTGDLRHVHIKATNIQDDTGFPIETFHHLGIVSGWPE